MIEALVLGSVVFLMVLSAVTAAVRVTLAGSDTREAARVAVVHAARHEGGEAASLLVADLLPDAEIEVLHSDDAIGVVARSSTLVPHPVGSRVVTVSGAASMPLAPFRSARE